MNEDKTGDGKPTADAAAAAEMAGAAAEEAAPTCDHNWRLCPFYCPACDTTFAISDDPVAWRRRIYAYKGAHGSAAANNKVAVPWSDGHVVTELASWSEGEDPPTQL